MQQYYAHSENEHGRRHGLKEHLISVAAMAREFADAFGSGDAAYYSGLWHDLGKFNPDFQRYLNGQRNRGPDHKGAGAKLAFDQLEPLALLVQGHHGGLRAMREFRGWLNEKDRNPATEAALTTARQCITDLEPPSRLYPPAWATKEELTAELWLRMVFSSLVDADYLDTEQHFKPQQACQRGTDSDIIKELWRRFRLRHQENIQAAAQAGTVNQVRSEVYAACIATAEKPLGIFRLAVPTGGGKTLSAMGFALKHAATHGLRRIIVAVPFTSITQQTASVYRQVLEDSGSGSEVVLEHHSSVEADEHDDYAPDLNWSRLASENWDAPVVVTTTVQLFNSLFSNRTSSTRKLHNLARSIIILDETQALPPELLEPILSGLRELAENYDTSIVLSTATQPAFQAIKSFADIDAVDIVPSSGKHYQALKRVRYEWHTNPALSWDEVAAIMQATPQPLTIVNTKKDALALLEALNDERVLHLSTLLCGRHRQDVIQEIKRRLNEDENCQVVSTQVVEAGVDLDFPMVLRAIGPLDSIIQAAGRCNRNGLLEEGRVVVFNPAEASTPPFGSYRIGTDETKAMLNTGSMDLDNPQVVTQYFRRLYQDIDTDAHCVQASRKALDYPKTAERFRMIDDDTVSAIVTGYGNAAEREMVRATMDELRTGGGDARRLSRRVQPWTVSIYQRQVEENQRVGLLEEIMPGLYEWRGTYDRVTGIGGITAIDPDHFIV